MGRRIRVEPLGRWGWIKRIRKGDVLKAPSGLLRVVRDVSHCGPSAGKTSVTFTIQHCSWTGKCYTVLTGVDLRTFGYQPTKGQYRFRKKIDRTIDREINGGDKVRIVVAASGGKVTKYIDVHRPLDRDKSTLDCCDVRGIA